MARFGLFFVAAALEIAGCYMAFLALRQHNPLLWIPAILALAGFAAVLAWTGTDSAGRVYAVYGGIYIVMSLAFMSGVERVRPDGWDLAGAALALAGAAMIFLAPRA